MRRIGKANSSIWLALIIGLAMVFAFSACGPAEDPDDNDVAVPDPDDDDDEVVGPTTLTIGRSLSIDNLDPHRTVSIHAFQVLFFLYDTLVTLDYDLVTLQPGLAESWDISDDGLLYTFHLRDDVYFHTGRHLTAEDVEYSMKRWIDEETASASADKAGPIKDIRAVDDYTVEIEFETPHSEFLRWISMPHAAIVDREKVEELGEDFGAEWSGGTGPFKFSEWIRRDRIVLERNPDYTWGAPMFQNSGPAHVDRIVHRMVPEDAARIMELETGNLDVIYSLPLSMVQRLKDEPSVEVIQVDPHLYTDYLGFKTSRPLVSDVRVRAAINHAIDKETMIETLMYGFGTPAYNVVPPGAPDYWDDVEDLWPKFDPEEAENLLEEAGWTMGSDGIRQKDGQKLSINLFSSNSPFRLELGTYVQAMLADVGIELQPEPHDLAALWPALRTEDFDMFSMDYPVITTGEAIAMYFHSRNQPAPNRMAWADPHTDQLIAQTRTAITPEERFEAARELQEIIAENILWVPLVHHDQFIAVRKGVEGVRPHGIYGSYLAYGLLDARVTE